MASPCDYLAFFPSFDATLTTPGSGTPLTKHAAVRLWWRHCGAQIDPEGAPGQENGAGGPRSPANHKHDAAVVSVLTELDKLATQGLLF